MANRLYYGDNFAVLRESIADESVDLVYLDPPFNSSAGYNVLFKAPAGQKNEAQIEAFEDTWHWTNSSARAFDYVIHSKHTDAATMLKAMRSFLGENDMMAYLAMMAARLIELHRVLRSTGSLYLHCDPTASHYLKILLDSIFPGFFRSEIIWKRTSAHNSAKRWGPVHDVILFYSKSENFKWNSVFQSYREDYVKSFYRMRGADGKLFQLGDLTGAGIRKGESGAVWRGINPTAWRRRMSSTTLARYRHATRSVLDTRRKSPWLCCKGSLKRQAQRAMLCSTHSAVVARPFTPRRSWSGSGSGLISRVLPFRLLNGG